MNINDLAGSFRRVGAFGQTLNTEERLKLELALLKIHDFEKFDEVLFWGKVQGVKKDYYLALALNFNGYYEFPRKKFFWASEDFVFAELPEINAEYRKEAETNVSLFSGEHDKIIIEVKQPEEEEENQEAKAEGSQEGGENLEGEEEEEKEEKIPPKNFTELDRLAYVVRAVDVETSVVPLGAFKITPSHELRRNEAFRGLSQENVGLLHNYFHFRNVQSQAKKELLLRDEALFHQDFFDPIEEDAPKCSWSIQGDPSQRLVTIRSLLWPGYVAFHECNTPYFGGVYIGNGLRNNDLAFML